MTLPLSGWNDKRVWHLIHETTKSWTKNRQTLRQITIGNEQD